MQNSIDQVQEDPPLLRQMRQDELAAPDLYQATNYWRAYSERFLPELDRFGLGDFRCRRNSVLGSFGATDPRPSAHEVPSLNRWAGRLLPLRVQRTLASFSWPFLYPLLRDRWFRAWYITASQYGTARGARPLADFGATRVGNPEDVYEVADRLYTMHHLNYYIQYAYCSSFVDFNRVQLVAELGSGSGKQVEIIKRLHPRITFILFDITPQLYVCEQYLKALFSSDIVSYRHAREMKALPREADGKVYICGAWQFPLIESTLVDLFWNSASFQEMEPDVVENYLGLLRNSADSVYLRERAGGQWVAKGLGAGGCLHAVTVKHYVSALHDFELIDFVRAKSVGYSDLMSDDYYDMFWRRRSARVTPAMVRS
jgi:putative sugar O-methyltransferase